MSSSVPFLDQDFVFGLSIILRGTVNDRLNWAFNLYDLNKDGCITKEVTTRTHRGNVAATGCWKEPNLSSVCRDIHAKLSLIHVSGDAGHHEVHLWYDGEVHISYDARRRPKRSRGELFPGQDQQPGYSYLHSIEFYFSIVFCLSENGQE